MLLPVTGRHDDPVPAAGTALPVGRGLGWQWPPELQLMRPALKPSATLWAKVLWNLAASCGAPRGSQRRPGAGEFRAGGREGGPGLGSVRPHTHSLEATSPPFDLPPPPYSSDTESLNQADLPPYRSRSGSADSASSQAASSLLSVEDTSHSTRRPGPQDGTAERRDSVLSRGTEEV